MNEVNTLATCGQMLEAIGRAPPGNYIFYAENGQLCLKKKSLQDKVTNLLLVVNSADVNKGFTPQQWERLDAAIRTARKEGILK